MHGEGIHTSPEGEVRKGTWNINMLAN
jgi:hypothetical protein